MLDTTLLPIYVRIYLDTDIHLHGMVLWCSVQLYVSCEIEMHACPSTRSDPTSYSRYLVIYIVADIRIFPIIVRKRNRLRL